MLTNKSRSKYVSTLDLFRPSKVTDIELTALMIAVNNLGTSVSPLPFSVKKRKSQTVDQTQSSRFEVSVPDQNKGKTSSEVESDTQTMSLTTTTDVHALLLSNDELIEESDDDVFEAVSQEHQSPTPHKEKPKSSHARDIDASDYESSLCSKTFKPYDNYIPITERKLVRNLQHISEVLYAQVVEDNWEKHEEAVVSYADLKASIKEYYEENVDHMDQTDKIVQETMTNLDKIKEIKKIAESNNTTSRTITSLTKLLRNAQLPEVITKLNDIWSTITILSIQCASKSESLKEEPEFNQRLYRAAEGYIQNSSRLTEIANSLKVINLLSFHQRITTIKNTQVTMQADISLIKRMMTEMLQAFKGMYSSTPSGSASIPTATQPEVNASIG
ncbi:hypothetical protein Tco_0802846 [Tanacetum coccineum]|uniref:Uncharacterized protein n=1 Tax=Tanacetum coccineum TaxID=301880 RepID=A0ABQ5A038_9ASTR